MLAYHIVLGFVSLKHDFYQAGQTFKFVPMSLQNPLGINFNSNDTFQEIFRTSAEGIIIVTAGGKIILANPVAEKMFGYDAGSFIGLTLEDLLPAQYRGGHASMRKSFNADPKPRRMGAGRDLKGLRKDGTEFPVEVSLSYTQIDDQLLVMAFISDITLRKAAEDALKKSEEQLIEYATELEKKVHTRTEALNSSIQKLETLNRDLQQQIRERQQAEEEARKALEKERELNDLKSKFVSIASHEFRTPLSTILSSTSLVQQYQQRGELDKADKHINRIKSSVQHLTAILNDFLSLGKLEEGRTDIARESISLTAFFKEVEEDVKPAFKENQQLIIKLSEPEIIVDTDPLFLRNIMFNLISNASKYSGPGSKINVNVTSSGHTFKIEVIDEGMGIPQHEVKHLFERFFRASNALNVQGTGLGLNIVKRYVELLNGTISFKTEERKGSTFTVELPS